VTKFDRYNLPVLEGTTCNLHGSKYYIVLVCYNVFSQISIMQKHQESTRISVPFGPYEYKCLPFGLSNRPFSFQRLMDIVLKNLVGTEFLFYLEDVTIISRSVQNFAQKVEHM